MDWIMVLLITLFVVTMTAFLLNFIPYPVGWLVLTLLFFIRLMGKR